MSIDQIHKIEQLNDHVYRIDENGIANCYLVIGSEKALLIDAGIGAGNLKKCVEQVTDKPIILAITHRHYDHVGGAWQFGTYYIHKYDSSFINKLMTYFLIANIVVEKQGISIENKRPLGRKVKEVKIEDGYQFDLGDRIITTKLIAGHSKGSIMLVDDKDKIIYTGDDVNPGLWMQISGCTSFKEWLVGARKVEKYLEEGYQAYYGHGDGVQTLEQVKQTIKIVEELIHQYKMGQIKEKSAIFPKEDVFPNVYYHKKYLK